jgi:hypothetical protein
MDIAEGFIGFSILVMRTPGAEVISYRSRKQPLLLGQPSLQLQQAK